MSFDPSPLLSILQQGAARSQRSTEQLTQMVLQQQQQRQQEQQRFGDELLGSVARMGGNVRKASGLLPPNALPPGRVEAWDEFAKLVKKREQQQQAMGQVGPTAQTVAGAQLEQQQARTPQAQRQAVQTQAQALSSLFSAAGNDPQVRQQIAAQLSGALAGQQLGMRQQGREQATERRQAVADATRDRLIEDAAGLIALDPMNAELQQEVLGLVQSQFPGAADEVTRATLARASVGAQTGVGATQSERLVSLLPPERRTAARARLLAQAESPTQTVRQRTPISVDRSLEIAERDDRNVSALELAHRTMRTIREDPSAVGFGARLRTAIQSIGEVARGFDSVLGTGSFDSFQSLAMERLSTLSPDAQGNEQFQELQSIFTNPNAAEVDWGNLVLAFILEEQLTGGRRFSIQAVQRIHEHLEGGATRPPAVTLRVLESSVRKMERETQRGRKRLRAVDPELFRRLEPTLEPIPTFQKRNPDFIFDPERGIVPFQKGGSGG